MKYLALVIILSGCANTATTPWCTSKAGTVLIGVPPDNTFPITSHKYGNTDWDCENFQRAEDLLLEAVEQITPQFHLNAKSQLKSVAIYFHDGDSWVNTNEIEIAGQALCNWNTIQISSSTPPSSAYAHEMFHVFQGCKAPLPIDKKRDEDHADWIRSGIYEAIDYWSKSWNF